MAPNGLPKTKKKTIHVCIFDTILHKKIYTIFSQSSIFCTHIGEWKTYVCTTKKKNGCLKVKKYNCC